MELDNTPEIYETLSKTFLALKASDKLGSNSISSSIAPIYDKLVATEGQLEKTRSDLLENIAKKVTEKFNDPKVSEIWTELIVSQVYDLVTLEFNPKFVKIEQTLSSLRNQIENSEERIGRIDKRLMIMIKSPYLIVLYFMG